MALAEAFQHDCDARMTWTIADRAHANHNTVVVVNGQAGKAPIAIDAKVGVSIDLDASRTTDPDGNALTFKWFYYPEAGTGIPTRPVFAGDLGQAPGGSLDEGGIASVPAGLREPPARVVIDRAATAHATATPKVPGTAHIILAVTDAGTPSLTSYRRIIVKIAK